MRESIQNVELTHLAFSCASRTIQEIAELEHKNFALEQENAIKTELKQVLDSWVRYEQQQRESEQLDLVKTVKAGVEAELAKPAFKKQLLEEALAHVESERPGRT
jgi:F-type H+-transporting ATPase subunit b